MKRPTFNKETLSLAVVIGLIGAGFLAMLVGVLRPGPKPAEPPPGAERFGVIGERSRESLTSYRRPLTVHEVGYRSTMETGTAAEASDYGVVIPDLPGGVRPSSLGGGMNVPPMPAAAARRPVRAEGEDEEEATRTGWGWLADDIAATRAGEGENRMDRRDGADPGREEEAADAPGAVPPMTPGVEDGSMAVVAFMDPAAPRDVFRFSTEPERASAAEARVSDLDRWAADQAEENRREEPWGARNPFEARGAGDALGASMDFRGGDPLGARAAAVSAAGTEAPARASLWTVGGGTRDAEAAGAGFGFGSDRVFGDGGGYAPRSVGFGQSDALFSGGGVFRSEGLGGGFGAGMEAGGAGGGLPSLETGRGLGDSGVGALLDAGGLGAERTTPRALPW